MFKIINLSKLNSITVFLGFTAMIVILSICINTFYWSDDYAFMVKLNQKGVLENCIYGYNTWDGRFLTLAAFFQGFLLHYVKIEAVTFFWTITFVLSCFFLVKILQQELKIKTNKQVFFWFLLTTVFWLGCYQHFSETVYWGTGGIYSLDLLLGAIWIYWYSKLNVNNFTISKKIYFILFSFIVGATTQNLTIALLSLIFIDIIIKLLKKEKRMIGFYSLLFVVVFGGMLFISLAPGNFTRIEKTGISSIDLSFLSLIKGFLQVGFAYAKISIVLILLSIIVAVGMVLIIMPNAKLTTKSLFFFPRNKILFIKFLSDYKWFLVSLSTILPFIIAPGLAFPRTALFFMYFLLLFIITFVYKLFSIDEKQIVSTNFKAISVNIMFSFIFIIAIGFGVYNFIKGTELKKFISSREQLLQKSKGKTVTIKLVNPEMESSCYDITDLSFIENERVAWRRLRLEEYYKVKKIIVEE
ncbi:DUF6056 family protein [Flavobacterium sp.]|uniref:DUF6056 family protein n=1 Tax=Flavobacterium sp. TaxID=239 RepID=UPI00261C24B0|nr:DUF6056 family protein [Flavobacterium sp.]